MCGGRGLSKRGYGDEGDRVGGFFLRGVTGEEVRG